ncbi:RNA polymerase sigma factor [Candidatus Woesearchaeota archaeon]|nr:RNA polymerase sigma factor [Candidatus Woesearchaeota archaeon]
MILEKFIYYYLKVVKFGGTIQEPKLSYYGKGIAAWFADPSNKRYIRNSLRRFNLNDQDFEDIFQEVHLKAYKSSPEFKEESAVETWVCRIAINRTLDLLRRNKRTRDKEVYFNQITDCKFYTSGIFAESSESSYQRKEILRLLLGRIDALPQKTKDAFILRMFDSMSYTDIAISLDISECTVMSRINYARTLLRREIKYTTPNFVFKNGHAPKSKHIPNLEHHLQYEPLTSHSQSGDEIINGNGMPNESPLTGKGKVYYLPRPSRQQRYQRKAHGTAITLEQSVANL